VDHADDVDLEDLAQLLVELLCLVGQSAEAVEGIKEG